MNKLDEMFFDLKYRFYCFLHDEEGDTNFISILVLLGIALALAGVFLAFKDVILGWVDEQMTGFFGKDPGFKPTDRNPGN